jgi:hypothetical protein
MRLLTLYGFVRLVNGRKEHIVADGDVLVFTFNV